MGNTKIAKWDTKFAACLEQQDWVNPQAEPELISYQHLLDGQGIALDLASGSGANALYLATLGYRVVACDGSLNALKIATASAEKHSLSLQPLVCDLQKPSLQPTGVFHLITVVRYLQNDLFTMIKNWLLPGGLVFYKTFNLRHLQRQPNSNPCYVLQDRQLSKAFNDFEIIASNEFETHQDSNYSYILARKPDV